MHMWQSLVGRKKIVEILLFRTTATSVAVCTVMCCGFSPSSVL